MPSILSPIDVMRMVLGYVGIDQEQQAKMSVQDKVDEFKAHLAHLLLSSQACGMTYATHQSKRLSLKKKK